MHSKPDDASVQDLKRLEQYEKIAQLRDAVLSGQHPTIKLPPGVLASKWSASGSREASRPNSARNAESKTQTTVPVYATMLGKQSVAPHNDALVPSSYEARTADINPLFLQKSEELIKAEFGVQRKRLEQGLAEECVQHRFKQDAAETYSDTELSLILLKALELSRAANPASAATPADEGMTANDEAASDSFDNDTFYSSKHPTPDSYLTSRVRNDSEEAQGYLAPNQAGLSAPSAAAPSNKEASSFGHEQAPLANSNASQLQSFHVQPTARTQDTSATSAHFQVPGLNNYTADPGQLGQAVHMPMNEVQDLSADSSTSGLAGNGQPYRNAQEHLHDSYMEDHPPSPLVRAHNLGPAAPHPAPPLTGAVEGHSAPSAELGMGVPRGAPAQVAALRNDPLSFDSPESSPQSGKDKKKKKKKKRKADKQAPEEFPPEIKPEPRSPSPMTAPTFVRPKKRQRQATRSGNNSDQDEVLISGPPQPHQESYYDPVPGYGVAHGYPYRAASAAVVPAPRYDGGYAPEPVYAHQPPPSRYVERPPGDTYARLPSQVLVDDGYREPQPIYRERYETSRMSVRPDADPYVGQPMPPPPPQRVYIDSSGREYLEPSRPLVRPSVAPTSQSREVIYEQPPPRAASRYSGHPAHVDNRDVVYAQPPPAYPAPRRVATQPEYMPKNYPVPWPREYSARPTGPPSDYAQVMPPPSTHYSGEPARDYASRAGSVRPAEPVRYEYGRMQSTQPEAVRSEGHPEPYRAEYMARPPAEAPSQYPGYSTRPPDQYYGQPPVRQGEEVAYIERPGGTSQGIVYANDGRREVYR